MDSSNFFDINDTSHLTWGKNLPHWHQDNKYAFITFRLSDSLPQVKLQEYQAEKEQWLKRHPSPWDEKTKLEYTSKFAKIIDSWLDNGYGSCLLGDPANRKIVEEAFHFYDNKKYELVAFVVMPNHVHLLVQLYENHDINSTIRSLKSYTAKLIKKNGTTLEHIWQSESYDRIIRNEDHFMKVISYIFSNNRKLAWVKPWTW